MSAWVEDSRSLRWRVFDLGNFVQACAEEERRIAAGWAHFWHHTGLGRYGTQLDHAFSLFHASRCW